MTNIEDLCGTLRIYLAMLALCISDNKEITLPSKIFLYLIKTQLALIAYI